MNDGLGAALEDFAQAMFSMLRSAGTLWLGALLVAVAAASGLSSAVGEHPGTGVWPQLGLALVASHLLARAASPGQGRRQQIALALGAAGVGLLLVGGAMSGARGGSLEVGGGQPTEAYTRRLNGQQTPVHLGSPLRASVSDGAVTLRLGLGEEILGSTKVPIGSDVLYPLGPWQIYVDQVVPGEAPDMVQITAKPREGEGEAVTAQVPEAGAITLPGGGRLTVERISPDYGQSLGAAARVRLDWQVGEETSSEVTWLFLEHPSLDARVGEAPWALTLDAVESTPKTVLGVQAAGGGLPVVAVGWLLLLVGLIGGRDQEVAS